MDNKDRLSSPLTAIVVDIDNILLNNNEQWLNALKVRRQQTDPIVYLIKYLRI